MQIYLSVQLQVSEMKVFFIRFFSWLWWWCGDGYTVLALVTTETFISAVFISSSVSFCAYECTRYMLCMWRRPTRSSFGLIIFRDNHKSRRPEIFAICVFRQWKFSFASTAVNENEMIIINFRWRFSESVIISVCHHLAEQRNWIIFSCWWRVWLPQKIVQLRESSTFCLRIFLQLNLIYFNDINHQSFYWLLFSIIQDLLWLYYIEWNTSHFISVFDSHRIDSWVSSSLRE